MTEKNTQPSVHFISLVLSLSQAAMQQMGKISNPITGKVERSIQQAEVSIDILAMLKEKTSGNLVKDEERIINDTLSNLQLNFVQEKKKSEEIQDKNKKDESAQEPKDATKDEEKKEEKSKDK